MSEHKKNSMAEFQTTETEFHVHWFDPAAAVTEPPSGLMTGHRHAIVRDDAGMVIGFGEAEGHTHEVRQEDIEFLKQKNHAQDDPELHEIKGVEIFRTGTWNGEAYTDKDLDDMVAAFDRVGFKPPVKLGHAENSGDRAWGWVTALRREGERLVADFADVPKQIFDIIVERGFDAVSSEIYFNLKRGGEIFRRALKAVALLGAETPAVSGLKPIREAEMHSEEHEGIHRVQLDNEEITMSEEHKTIEELTAQLEEANAKLAEAEKGDEEVKIAELKAEVATLSLEKTQAELAEAKKAATHAADPMEVKSLKENLEALQKERAEEREQTRLDKCREFGQKCKMPVLREHAEALMDLATMDSQKTVMFTVGDGDDRKKQSVSPVKVIEDLFGRIDKLSQALIRETGNGGELKRDDMPSSEDPGEALNEKARVYAAKNKVEFAQALDHVMQDPENRDLVRAYNES